MYNKFFADRNNTRLDLFRRLKEKYGLESSIYPGSFVHITPSLVFDRTAYLDMDKRVDAFFSDEAVGSWVDKNKEYEGKSEIYAAQQDYSKKLPEDIGTFDLMISQYAGFVSRDCKQYLNEGSILLANNSHGDAGLAFLDPDYTFVAVANHEDDKWTIKDSELEDYFIPKKGEHPPASAILKTMKGIGYKKTAANYIFRKVSQ